MARELHGSTDALARRLLAPVRITTKIETRTRGRTVIAIEARLSDCNPIWLAQFTAELCRVTGDPTIRAIHIDPSTMRITIIGDDRGVARLYKLWAEGCLPNLCGRRLIDVPKPLHTETNSFDLPAGRPDIESEQN